MTTCQKKLRADGKAYPRTCAKCGLVGPCHDYDEVLVPKGAKELLEGPLAPQVPVLPPMPLTGAPRGCICPPGSEATCQSWNCGRKPPQPMQTWC